MRPTLSIFETNTKLCETHIISQESKEWLLDPKTCQALALYNIGLTGISHISGDFCIIRESPRLSQLLVTFEGSGRVWLDGKWETCAAGSAYITPPGVGHGYHSIPDVDWKFCWVIYTKAFESGPTIGIERPIMAQVDYHPLISTIENLHRETLGQAEPSVLHHWAALLNSYAQRSIAPAFQLQAVWDAVNADLAHHWTNDELAGIASVSTEHLRRLSQREVNRSPMRHVTELRMRQAAAMLASEGSYKIEQVAERVGYDNAYAFSTAFKKCIGLAPSRYRNKRT